MTDDVRWSPTRCPRNGQVEIAWDEMLGSEGDPLLLVMGLGTSRFWWPAGLCQALAAEGFHVVRYDQRDAGRSSSRSLTASTIAWTTWAGAASGGGAATSEPDGSPAQPARTAPPSTSTMATPQRRPRELHHGRTVVDRCARGPARHATESGDGSAPFVRAAGRSSDQPRSAAPC